MIKTFSLTDVGMKRKLNQDYVFSSEEPVGHLPNLFIVADGMGGHKAGDHASRCAVNTMVESIKANEDENPIRIIREAVERANHEVFVTANENPDMAGMGTTTVAATICEDVLYVANVGDSRLYVVDDDIHQITKDHSLVEEMIRMGEIARGEARNHPDKNIITRAIGAADDIRIDFFDLNLKEGDLIVMCSDGLSNMVDDDEICMTMKGVSDVVEKAETLVKKANDNGGRDNIAVIVIDPFGDR